MCIVTGPYVSNVFRNLQFPRFFVSVSGFVFNVCIEETSLMTYKIYQGQDFAYCTTVMSCNTLLINWCLELRFSLESDLNFSPQSALFVVLRIFIRRFRISFARIPCAHYELLNVDRLILIFCLHLLAGSLLIRIRTCYLKIWHLGRLNTYYWHIWVQEKVPEQEGRSDLPPCSPLSPEAGHDSSCRTNPYTQRKGGSSFLQAKGCPEES